MEKQKKQLWYPIDHGIPEKVTLERWIKEYFNVNLDLSNFKRRNNTVGNGIEVSSLEEIEGFVFVNERVDTDYEKRTEIVMNLYVNSGKKISRKFVDYEEKLAGFDWRAY